MPGKAGCPGKPDKVMRWTPFLAAQLALKLGQLPTFFF
jgi:hypothetical protein